MQRLDVFSRFETSITFTQILLLPSMPNTLQDFLEAADGAGNMLAHTGLLLRLAYLYEQIAPAHLRQASR